MKGLWGSAVLKEPLGPSPKGLELGSEAGSDAQAVVLGIPPMREESKDLNPCCARVFSGTARQPLSGSPECTELSFISKPSSRYLEKLQ